MQLVPTDRSEAGRPRDIGMGTDAPTWLVLAAIPLVLIDVAVHRLPDPLTAAAFTGTLALLAVAALSGHQPGRLARAAIGAAILACFYLALWLIRPDGMGLGDAKLAASIGLVLGWTSWQALLTGTFAGFALAAVYGGVQMARHQATRTSQLPLGPFILLGTLTASRSYMCRFLFLPSLSRFCCRLSGPSETRKRGKRRWATAVASASIVAFSLVRRLPVGPGSGGYLARSRTGLDQLPLGVEDGGLPLTTSRYGWRQSTGITVQYRRLLRTATTAAGRAGRSAAFFARVGTVS